MRWSDEKQRIAVVRAIPWITRERTGWAQTEEIGSTTGRALELASRPAPLDELERARFLYRLGMRGYASERQDLLATPIRPQDNAMFEEPTWEHVINNACYHVSVILGGFARRQT